MIAGDGRAARADGGGPPTVEAEVRARISGWLGGPRGAAEAAVPFVAFTIAFVVIDELGTAIALGVAASLLLLVVRLVQRSTVQFVGNGLFAIALAAVITTVTGRAETAFLPGIVQSAVWAVVLAGSILARRPAAGFVIGAVIDDSAGWSRDPAIVRLANRLTVVFVVPMVVRVAVMYPLYLAGEVGWLGVARVVLGWPLSGVALAAAATILARGHTPHVGGAPEGPREDDRP